MKAYIVDQIVLHSHCLPEHSVPDLRTVHYTVAASSTTEVRLPKYFQRCQARMWLLSMFPIVLIRNNCRWASYWELAVLQPFGEQAQAGAVPEDQLHSVGSLARKQKITPENGSARNCSFTSEARPSLCGSPRVSSPSAPGSVRAGSAFRHSCVRAPNRAQHCFHVSRIGAARHPHLDYPHHDLDAGGTALMGGFVHLC